MKKLALSITSLIMAVLMLSSCSVKGEVKDETESDTTAEAVSAALEETETETQSETQTESQTAVQKTEPASQKTEVPTRNIGTNEDTAVNIVAVGDNLIHGAIYNQAHARSKNGRYDFEYAYKNVAPSIRKADISILNQETIIDPTRAPATYPCFNSPVELGDEMVKIGFDVINLANNHSLDQGESGLRNAIKYWDSKNVIHCGAYLNKETYKKIPSHTVKGIKFSYVGLTDPTNGLSLKPGAETILMLGANENMIKERIIAAKKISDIVVVNVHWGVEYTHTPTDRQRSLAKKMASWGADIIVGNHPHVIQPVEYIKNADGRKTLCIYSLGNFISSQDRAPRMLGGMMHIKVTKDYKTNNARIADAYFTGTVTHYDANVANVRVYNLSDYTPALAKSHGVRVNDPQFSIEYMNGIINNVIDKQFLRG